MIKSHFAHMWSNLDHSIPCAGSADHPNFKDVKDLVSPSKNSWPPLGPTNPLRSDLLEIGSLSLADVPDISLINLPVYMKDFGFFDTSEVGHTESL